MQGFAARKSAKSDVNAQCWRKISSLSTLYKEFEEVLQSLFSDYTNKICTSKFKIFLNVKIISRAVFRVLTKAHFHLLSFSIKKMYKETHKITSKKVLCKLNFPQKYKDNIIWMLIDINFFPFSFLWTEKYIEEIYLSAKLEK